VLGTQTVATLIAVYGLFMAPLGWKWAGFVWGYALVWALVNDRVKLLAYKIFDPVKVEPKPEAKADAPKPDAKAEQPKPEAKADEPKSDQPKPEVKADTPSPAPKAEQPKPEAKAEPKPEDKVEPKPEAKADEPKSDQPKPEVKADAPSPAPKAEEPKPAEAKAASDLTPQIAARAYELYGERAGNDGTAVQDWKKAEQEIRNDEAKAAPKPEAKADAPAPEEKAAPTPEAKADEPRPETKAEPKPEGKVEPKPESKDKPQPDVTPHLVKRVRELYEELGREDVQTVQDWEKADRKLEEHETHK
jgi:H+-transporting ATPase